MIQPICLPRPSRAGRCFTVETGEFSTSADLFAALETAGVVFFGRERVIGLLSGMELCQERAVISYIVVNPEDVGGTAPLQLNKFYAMADGMGFGSVPQESGALVALQCARMLQDGSGCGHAPLERFVAGSPPIEVTNERQYLLYVAHLEGGGIGLGWRRCDPDKKWYVTNSFLRASE